MSTPQNLKLRLKKVGSLLLKIISGASMGNSWYCVVYGEKDLQEESRMPSVAHIVAAQVCNLLYSTAWSIGS